MCLHDIERAAHDTGWLEFEQICRGTVYGSAAANTGGFRHMLLATTFITTRSPRRLSLAVFVFRRYCTSGKAYESGTFCCLAWSCAGGSRSGSFRTGSKFFLRVDGRLFSSHYFLHYFLPGYGGPTFGTVPDVVASQLWLAPWLPPARCVAVAALLKPVLGWLLTCAAHRTLAVSGRIITHGRTSVLFVYCRFLTASVMIRPIPGILGLIRLILILSVPAFLFLVLCQFHWVLWLLTVRTQRRVRCIVWFSWYRFLLRTLPPLTMGQRGGRRFFQLILINVLLCFISFVLFPWPGCCTRGSLPRGG